MGIECFEMLIGWKFFGNLLDVGCVIFCGEESVGIGLNYVCEKDGLWVVLFWLNILVEIKKLVVDLMLDYWVKYGCNYYSCYDYEDVEMDKVNVLMDGLCVQFVILVG